MATLRLGYEVFAIRQMGVCATSKDAHLYFRHLGDGHGYGGTMLTWKLIETTCQCFHMFSCHDLNSSSTAEV